MDVARHRAQVALLSRAVQIDHRLHVVVRDHSRAGPGGNARQPPQKLRLFRSRGDHRYVRQIRDTIDTVLGHLRHDRIGHPVLRVQPEIGPYLAAPGERDQETVGDIALGQADFPGERAVDGDVDLRVVKHLLDAQVRDARHGADALQELGGIGVVGLAVVADDLQVDRGRQTEVQDLRDDVGRQK